MPTYNVKLRNCDAEKIWAARYEIELGGVLTFFDEKGQRFVSFAPSVGDSQFGVWYRVERVRE